MTANQKGYTLVEVLVAVLVFVIGVVALTNTLLTTIRGNNLGAQETVAATLANDKLEELRSINPSQFYIDNRLAMGPHVQFINPLRATLAGITGGYEIRWTVTDTAGSSMFYTTLKDVTLTVSWYSPAYHSVRMQSTIVPNI